MTLITTNTFMNTQRSLRVAVTIFVMLKMFTASADAQEVRIEKGIIRIVQSVDVSVKRAGVIRTLDVQEGDKVEQDQIVGKLYDKSLRLQLEKARTQYEIAKRRSSDDTLVEYAKSTAAVANAELARALSANRSVALAISDTELDRLKLVFSKSQLESDKAKIDLDVATLTQKLARVEIADAENEIEQRTIKSPIEGIVVSMYKSAGEWAGVGDRVFKVVRMNRLRVEGQLRVDKTIGVMINSKARVEVDLPGGDSVTREGKVVFVSPEVNTLNGNVSLWVEFDNLDGRLRPGLQATVVVGTGEDGVESADSRQLEMSPTETDDARPSTGSGLGL